MTQELLKPFGPEEVPYVELRDEAGKLFSPPGLNVHSQRIWFEGDKTVVSIAGRPDGIVIGETGQAVARIAPFGRPSSNERAAFRARRDTSDQGTFVLENPQREALHETAVLHDSIGRYGPASVQWSPSGTHLIAGGYKMVAVIGFERETVQVFAISRGIVHRLAWLDEERVAFLDGGQLSVFSALTGQIVSSHSDANFREIWGLSVSPERTELLVGGNALYRVPLEALDRGARIHLPNASPGDCTRVLGFVGESLLMASVHEQLFLLSWPDGRVMEVVQLRSGIEAAALDPTTMRLVTAGWCTLQFFARGADGPRRYDMPNFPPRSVVAARRGQSGKFPKTLKALEKRVASMQPFSQLGEPLPYDKHLVRVTAFSAWGGPESVEDDALGQQVGTWQQAIKEAVKVSKKDLGPIRPIVAKARGLAEQRIQLTPDEIDDNYAPRYAALVYLEEIVELVASFLFLEAKLPDDLKELFLVFEAGHWPCGYQVDSGPENDEPKVEKLIVY